MVLIFIAALVVGLPVAYVVGARRAWSRQMACMGKPLPDGGFAIPVDPAHYPAPPVQGFSPPNCYYAWVCRWQWWPPGSVCTLEFVCD